MHGSTAVLFMPPCQCLINYKTNVDLSLYRHLIIQFMDPEFIPTVPSEPPVNVNVYVTNEINLFFTFFTG